MKRNLIAAASLLLVITAACAPAVPTVDPVQIQASAVAAANTMVAMTQAAIPTPTEIPPTPVPSPTPLPSPTLVALPTLDLGAAPTPAPASTTSSDPCNAPMSANPLGKMTKVLISNANKGSIVLSLYLYKTPFGECGYRGFNVGGNSSLIVTMPQGCYFAGAFVNTGKAQSKSFGDALCMNNPDKWVLNVGPDRIWLTPP